MKNQVKATLTAYVYKETKERFENAKKQTDLKNDAFINHLLDLLEKEQNQEREGKDHEKSKNKRWIYI